MNLQDEEQAKPNTFERRYLYHDAVQQCLKHTRHRSSLYKTLRAKVIEVKASDFGKTIDNAKEDVLTAQGNNLLLQPFVNEVFDICNLGTPPTINASINNNTLTESHTINWNIDFKPISEVLGKKLNFSEATPLLGAIHCNRFLWTAANLNSDLFLGKPMSTLAGNKLYESECKIIKSHDVLDSLKAKVEFPSIRDLVNDGKLSLSDILSIRKESKKFRIWLQDEKERDRDAIIAYHHEVAKKTGLIKFGGQTLKLFGYLVPPVAGVAIGAKITGDQSQIIGAGVGAGMSFLFDLASKIEKNWKPVIFGNWLKDEIERRVTK